MFLDEVVKVMMNSSRQTVSPKAATSLLVVSYSNCGQEYVNYDCIIKE
jgi:hypothetical protein